MGAAWLKVRCGAGAQEMAAVWAPELSTMALVGVLSLTLCSDPLSLHLQEQASWVCQCKESVVQRLEQDFKLTLQQQSSLDQWASWLDNVVTQVLKQHAGSPSFPKAARQFLLKWSFYR